MRLRKVICLEKANHREGDMYDFVAVEQISYILVGGRRKNKQTKKQQLKTKNKINKKPNKKQNKKQKKTPNFHDFK